ncbi:LptF/LptG family permease [Candidatus Poribacteria bacterium]|nr:LptF/LptG family permease [Candidatus Poribacteria bacterium]
MKKSEFKINLLFIYVLKEFISPFFYSTLSFLAIFIVVEVLQRIRTFHDNNVIVKDIVSYYIYKIPFIIIQMLPIIIILATLFSLGNLIKNNEIVALRSSGINIINVFSPLFIFSLLLGIIIFFLNESIIPHANYMANKINNERIRKIVIATDEIQANMAYRGKKGELLFAEKFYITGKTLQGIKLFIFDEKNSVSETVIADNAFWNENEWIMEKGYVRKFKKDIITKEESVIRAPMNLSSSPQDLCLGQQSPEQLSYWELKKLIKKLKQGGQEYKNYLADLYVKTSSPFSSFIIIVLGIPMALRNQTGSRSIEFGLGLTISFVFWGTNQVFYSMGKNGILLPFLSAWLGNILFLIIGGYMIYRQR